MRETIKAIRVALVLWILTAIIYPLFTIIVGQVLFSYQANGSIIENQGRVYGSALIGQPFSSPQYFTSRPSTTNYSSFTAAERDPKNISQITGVSGASNLAPTNPDLLKRVEATTQQLKASGIQPTADIVYTSGSSLDPHISVETAYNQAARVAAARSLSADRVQALIPKYTDGRFLGIFGEPGVNVLKLNLALDNLQSASNL
ncbi:K(+)-transporting ATPase subunit C [Coleofasciculus sp. FACHB-T130]|uniref:K(+)-transporting ATPase subunit C n=1 Tax=Cyanophyceae TaxID=3028117 RepID=UPI00168705A4|nr:K(+)-transporting ATPase subunit C [Coleofasciculus sp. FACHB-T130]MBD1879223.1 K(+)-transporting ATPase subunit C [Coleofasciculus sp. FACHB-T130]